LPFTGVSACKPPCLRFAMAVSGHHARLGTRLRARLCRGLHFRRLNFMSFKAQPAQFRTSASTHTALLKDESRESEPRPRSASRTSSKRWDMHIPAQSQEHVRLNDVLLQLHPSLPTLRSSLRRLVRMVHRCRVGGGATDFVAGHRPPLKLHVRFSRIQLSRRLNESRMQEKELIQPDSQAHTPRRAWLSVVVSNHSYASA